MNIRHFLFFFLGFLLIASCGTNRFDADISDIEVSLEMKRFEQDLMSVQPDSLNHVIPELKNKYGDFFRRFVENIISIGLAEDPALAMNLRHFVEDKDISDIYSETEKKYNTLEDKRKEMEKAFRYFKFYFPEHITPEIVTFISGFNYAIVALDSSLGIGLDMYLGKNYEYYEKIAFPKYKRRTMTEDYITSDAMRGWVSSVFAPEKPLNDMLSKIIHEGKMLYLLNGTMPDAADSVITGFTKEQLNWCRENEYNLWVHFVDNELLYTTDYEKIRQYTGEGPFTTGLPKESPAQTGVWLGWQIVRSYMEHNSEVSLKELAEEKDAQKILNVSNYKPS